MGDIFREVDEELKQERYELLWRRYGTYIIAAAVLVVAAVGGWKVWSNYETGQRYEEGQKFGAAVTLLQAGKTKEAEASFASLGGETGSGYGILSHFYDAGLRAKAGDAAGAIKIYDGIAADSGAPDAMRNLATVLGGLQALGVPSIDAAAIERRIQPLTGPGSAYRHIALEILALTAQRSGDIEKAKTNYKAIVDDPEAAPGIRSRAAQMLSIFGES